ncbi:MAG: serine hydrolase [Verrucomicrobiales bacterium]|nr:serine hydrolase [Verrucomicrobiales bacterium]
MKVSLSILVLFLASIAPGQDGEARLESLFERVDSDQDGKVSREELIAAEQRIGWLERADTDGDGMVDRGEVRSFLATRISDGNKATGEITEVTVADIPGTSPLTREGIKRAEKYSADRGGHSFLVMLGGQILHESYANAWDPSEGHRLASGTKSFSGALLALAAKDGLFTPDDLVSGVITEWQADHRKGITIRQLLNLTSGIDPGENAGVLSYREAVKVKAVSGPDKKFRYGPNAFQIFGEYVKRKLKEREDLPFESPVDYLEARVFEPIGMKYTQWRQDEDEMQHLPSGCFITAREWAKFGQLLLQNGTWDEQVIIDPAVLSEATRPVSKVNPGYGLTFWLLGREAKNRPWLEGAYMAAGAGKQRLYILPAVNMVVVRQGESRRFENVDFLDPLFRLETRGNPAESGE